MSFFGSRRKILEDDLVDLHGKVVVITGGNSGIGFTTIQFLARKGAKVYMACRREAAYRDAVGRLEEAGLGDGTVHWIRLDLSDPRLARKAAEDLLKKEDRLDILINNAAKIEELSGMTKDGIREGMVTNYLSHFLFTEKLLPLMIETSKKEGSDVRILNVTSAAHGSVSPATFKDKKSWNTDHGNTTMGNLKLYGLSKLANILHIKHLQGRLDLQKADITCMAIDPGAIATENVNRWINSMSEGAMNSAYGAASPEVKARAKEFKGVQLTPVGRTTLPSSYARDERLAQELYETSMSIVAEMMDD